MENRFGIRDLINVFLMLVLIITVWLAMKQNDRQWEQLVIITQQLKEQTRDLASLRRSVAESADAGAPATTTAPAIAPPKTAPAANATQSVASSKATDPFARIKAAQKQPGYVTGDNYVDVFSVVPKNLTPLIKGDAYSSIIHSHIQESLVDRDPDTLEFTPFIAKTWRISADGLRIEFDLRKGVTFSDGQALTADDVVYTFNLIMNESVECPDQKSYYEKIKEVVKLDDYSVAFIFKEPYFQSFELAGTMPIMPKHFYGKYSPQEFNRSTGLLMGSGPYRMADPTSWKPEPGKPIEIVRNERYWGQPAPFEKIIYRVIDNEAARFTTFRNGDIDVLYTTSEQYQTLLADQEILKKKQHFQYNSPNAGYVYIGWNQQRGGKPTIFADKRVRQAMTMLIDRERICKEIQLGYAKVATGPFNPLGKQCDPKIKAWPYDPDAAKKLLKEAGFEDREKAGVLTSTDGKPLRFKLSFPSGSETYKRVALFIKDTLARAGVICEPDPTEWSVLIKRLDDRDFEAASLGWTAGLETDLYQIFHSSQAENAGDNYISYKNPELDKMIDQARATVDEAARMPLWNRAHQILHEDQPYTFMFIRDSLIFQDNRIANVKVTKTGLSPDVEWWVPASKWKWNIQVSVPVAP